MILALLACTGGGGPDVVTSFPGPHAVVTTAAADYSVGALAIVDLDDLEVHDDVAALTGDPVVSVDGGWVFQLNRYNYDTLRAYRPGEYAAPEADLQLPDRSNPYDAAVCDGLVFTALYDEDHLLVHDPDGWLQVGEVDLSAFADGDDVGPEPASVMAWDGALYVAMQRRRRHEDWALDEGAIARVDCGTLAVTDAWQMGANLRLTADADGAPLVYGEPHEDEAGGMWRVDGARVYVSSGPVVDGVAVVGDRAVVSAHDPETWAATIGCVDLGTGAWTPVEETDSYVVAVAAGPDEAVWVAKRTGWIDPDRAPAELARWDPVSCAPVGAVHTALEPFAVGFVP